MAVKNGLMIGVVHRDPSGEERLYRLLRDMKPTLITLEISPYALAFRQENSRRLVAELERLVPPEQRNHGEIQAIYEMLKIPFEVRAAARLEQAMPVRFECIDDSEFSRRFLAKVESEIIISENLSTLLGSPDVALEQRIDVYYRRFHELRKREPVHASEFGFSSAELAEMAHRDDQMERRIRELRQDHRWVHVGGVAHLISVDGAMLLWDRFRNEDMQRLFLDEA